MTIKPNYIIGFGKIFAEAFITAAVVLGIVSYLHGEGIRVGHSLGMAAFAGIVIGISVAVIFTPTEITWDEERIRIRALFRVPGDFTWKQLDAWSPAWMTLLNGTFLLKFEDRQAYQIARVGFRSGDWKIFQSFLQERFPKKKISLWFGVRPVRFRKKDDS